MKRMFSLRYKMLIFAFFMAIIPILIVGSFSYTKSTEIVREQAIRLNMETIKQIANNIEFIMKDVQGISFNIIENELLSEYLKSPDFHRNPDVYKVLDEFVLTKKYIYSIYVQDLQGNWVDTQGAINLFETDQFEYLFELNGKEDWFLSDVTVAHVDLQLISLARIIRDVNNLSSVLGVLKVNLSQDQIRNIYRQKVVDDDEMFFMIDKNGIVLSSKTSGLIGQPLDEQYVDSKVFDRGEGYYTTDIEGINYLVEFYTIRDTGWKLIHFVPSDRITQSVSSIKKIITISISLSLFICLAFLIFFMVKVLRPMRQIRKLMGDLEQENFNVTMPIQGNDEIALLGRSFNKMSQKLNELFNEVHVVKIKQKEAEIRALEEQINPHFLYNTLDLIYWMGRMENAFETSEMIRTLSKLFRLGLNKGSGYTTVSKELEYIQHYMAIQQKRYEDSITFSIDADEETLDLKVIKLILQPLVENAITHGIEKKDGKGQISVRVYCRDQMLIYEVEDDGAGMEPELIHRLLHQEERADDANGNGLQNAKHNVKHDAKDMHQNAEKNAVESAKHDSGSSYKGLGLKNINDRIKLSYGDEYGLVIESELGRGTKVIVKQPILKGDNEHVQDHDR